MNVLEPPHRKSVTFKITDEKIKDEIRQLGKKLKLDQRAGKSLSYFPLPKRQTFGLNAK